MRHYDAVVVGAGPNGLSAAVELTRSGRRVLVVEASREIGGGTRTKELTLPGFHHDVCSAIHPLGAGSPFFRSLGIDDWIHPDIPATHPLDGGRAGVVFRDLAATAKHLGEDGPKYRAIIGPLTKNADSLIPTVLGPLGLPSNPVTLARFGVPGVAPATVAAKGFSTPEARGIIAGMAAHAIAPLDRPFTAAVAELFLVAAHAYGWPLVPGGSQRLTEHLAEIVIGGGGSVETGHVVSTLNDIPDAPIVMLDVMPPAALRIAGKRVDPSTTRRLSAWRGGPGVFKVDWALDGPVPWKDPFSGRAGTVHVGGTFGEIARAEADVAAGKHPERPFVLVAQQSLFDAQRAPEGQQTLWAYTHVPAASTVDMTGRIESQIERFAPGFRDRVLARHTTSSTQYEVYNPNLIGGDIAGGTFSGRRALRFGSSRHYRIADGVYLCGSSTPPGAGVHGMCGYHAARAAIADQG